MALQKILVTGAEGQLGKCLQDLAKENPSFKFIFCSKAQLDITSEVAIKNAVEEYQPSYLVNTAAYTAVDLAESEKEKAFVVNADSMIGLSRICKEKDTRLIHISTDYVFNGDETVPYKEDDVLNPINVYGDSKAAGEINTLKENPGAIIIRSSWIYSSYGKNFVKTMLQLMRTREQVRVVNDQFGSPTYAADLAVAILNLIVSNKWVGGIYHYTNTGIISWYEFALAIKEIAQLHCEIIPITTSEFPTAAKRPSYSALDNRKIQATYGIIASQWKKSLSVCLEKIGSIQS
jgi:dTDP-4-dehydrorhamnose reductase